jgi:RNAse (barnase) inhibitor barstar
METVLLTEEVIAAHPEKRELTFQHAKEMCLALDALWDNLQNVVENPKPFLK